MTSILSQDAKHNIIKIAWSRFMKIWVRDLVTSNQASVVPYFYFRVKLVCSFVISWQHNLNQSQKKIHLCYLTHEW